MLNFEEITLDKQMLYSKYFDKTPEQSADYTFVNLFGLKNVYQLEWAFTEHLVWIRQRSPYTLYWAPVGDWNIADFCLEKPCEISDETILRIPQMLAKILKEKTNMSLHTIRDEWEYLYDANELINLPGKKFHNKKNLCNQFEKNDYIYKPIERSMTDDILEFEEKWEEAERQTINEEHSEDEEAFDKKKIVSHEVRAEADVMLIKSVLYDWENINKILGGVLMVYGKIVAYTIACKSMRDTFTIHSERGDRNFKGAYQAINRIFLQQNQDDNFKFVNREQDVGDLGLRKAKISYNPVGFIEKYTAHCLCD